MLRWRDEEVVVNVAGTLDVTALAPGDQVRWDRTAWMAFEKIAAAAGRRFLLDDVPDVSRSQVGGQEASLDALLSALTATLVAPDTAARYGLGGRRSILMVGPPGCGKTLMARVAAAEVTRLGGRRCRFGVVKPAEWESPWVGETQQNIRSCFRALRESDDGCAGGNAYGSHLNFLVTRRAWDGIFQRKLHHLLYLAAFQVSSIVYTGQGKVGAENGRPPAAFQLSQRADFFETLTGIQTTYRRPIVNGRDEALCGERPESSGEDASAASRHLARLHCIFFDNTLCHCSSLLKVGTMQLVLALLEAERVNPDLLLDNPVAAVVRWSHDPTLAARARLASGKALTAVELQMRFLEEAQRFAAAGGFDEVVPRAGEILALWEDTLEKLGAGDVIGLASRLDWMLKFRILQRAVQEHRGLTWASPEIKHLDHLNGSLDPAEGLYWAYEELGAVERLVTEAEIERFVHEPAEDAAGARSARVPGRHRADLGDS